MWWRCKKNNKRELVKKNVMIVLNPDGYERNFKCNCGCNVFSKYIENDSKVIFICHGCNEEYTGN